LERVAAYIDGFNLYHAMMAAQRRKYLWLDLRVFCERLLAENQKLILVKYFTSLARHKPQSWCRQMMFLDALRKEAGISPVYGEFTGHLERSIPDDHGQEYLRWTEKKTDVNLAVALVIDAYQDVYDAALLVSADGDLSPAAFAITQPPLRKRLHVRLPPGLSCIDLRVIAHSCEEPDEHVFASSQMPDVVVLGDGRTVHRPDLWR
jgi:uncharacterized LabA/DUF88 family protein